MNRFIRVDSQQCIGCKACEVACVMSHNEEQHVLDVSQFVPRITVVKMNSQCGAATCHHCEDAPCARSCPNGAIRHADDAILVDQAKCIGCKSCVVACPFGTMQIVLTPTADGRVKATAHKCDLCHERPAGPACVENCPANALQLMTSQQLTEIARTRRLHTACRDAQPW
ncbi:MAG: 4Fe-4S dicluster domain-containing protein, partial [Kluyvera intermedia]